MTGPALGVVFEGGAALLGCGEYHFAARVIAEDQCIAKDLGQVHVGKRPEIGRFSRQIGTGPAGGGDIFGREPRIRRGLGPEIRIAGGVPGQFAGFREFESCARREGLVI